MKPVNSKIAHYMPYIGVVLLALSFVLKHLFVPILACDFLAGIGCAWVGMGVVGVLIKRFKSDYAKKKEIEQKDERNIQIREKSGYISYLVTLFSLMVVIFMFFVLDDTIACILSYGVLMIHIVSYFVALSRYNKKY